MRNFCPLFYKLLLCLALLFSLPAWAGGFPDRLEILAKLDRRDFDGLERLLDGLQAAAEREIALEAAADFAFDSFATGRPGVGEAVQQWAKARPKSAAAQLAAGRYFANLARERRGSEFADKTSPAQFAAMAATFDQAEPYLKAALALNPKLTGAYDTLIGMAMFRGDDDAEAGWLAKGLAVAPASYRIRRAHLQALLPRWGGSHQAMAAFAKDSQKYVAQSPKLKTLLGLVAWDQGSLAVDAEDYAKAVELFSQALEAGGESAPVFYFRADARNQLKQFESALQDAEAALRLYPQDSEYLAVRARALAGLGKLEAAVADLELANAIDPCGECTKNLRQWLVGKLVYEGSQAYSQGQLEKAKTRYGQALRLEPNRAQTYYWRGRGYLAGKAYPEAEADLQQAFKLDPAHLDTALSLQFLYVQQQRWADIETLWNQAAAANPANAQIQLERAGTLRRVGKFPAALESLKRACDLGSQEACGFYRQEQQKGTAPP